MASMNSFPGFFNVHQFLIVSQCQANGNHLIQIHLVRIPLKLAYIFIRTYIRSGVFRWRVTLGTG